MAPSGLFDCFQKCWPEMTGILNHELKVTGACFSSVSTFCSVSTFFSVSTSCSVSISCFTWETLGPALETTPVSILSGRPETSFNGFHLNFRLPTTNRCTYEQLQKIISLCSEAELSQKPDVGNGHARCSISVAFRHFAAIRSKWEPCGKKGRHIPTATFCNHLDIGPQCWQQCQKL